MRILHLAPRPDAGSGISGYASRFRSALREAGAEIVQMAAPADLLNSTADVISYARAAMRESRGYDVVHAEIGGAALREFYGASLIARADHVPVCLTLHDPPRVVWWPFHTHLVRQVRLAGAAVRRLSAPMASALEASLLAKTQAVFVLTDGAIPAVQASFPSLPAERVHRLHYPIAAVGADPPPADRDVLTVGFFGYWYPGKGLELLVEAIARLQSDREKIRVRLWGDISPSAGRRIGSQYRDRIVSAVSRVHAEEAVEVLGYLDADMVASSLLDCDAIVLPYETTGVVAGLKSTSASMYEALAAGTPVIAADVKALHEVVRHGDNGLLFAPGDAAGLAAHLRELANDTALRARLRRGALATAQTFSTQRAASDALAEYERALRPRSR